MSKQDVVVGIDIGGTNTIFGLVDETGKCVAESRISTQRQDEAPVFFKRLYAAVEDLRKAHSEHRVVGIGIGAPNANYYTGTVELPPNLNWGIVNVVDITREYYPNLKTVITNDANAAAIGEMKFGAGIGLKHFIVITLGTGLGSGIVVDGKVVYGHDGFAGEIGHVIYDPRGRECGCGRRGCLEAYASASGICRTVSELLAESIEPSMLRHVSFEDLTSKSVTDAALKKDPIALKAFEITADILGKTLADSVAYTSPEAFILFGGLAKAGDLLLVPLRLRMEHHMLNIFKNKVKILPSGMTEGNTAVLGAGALIWNELQN